MEDACVRVRSSAGVTPWNQIVKWSQIKRRIKEFIVVPLQGRVQFYITSYAREDAVVGRGWVTVDGEEVLSVSSAERQAFYEVLRDYPDTSIENALVSPNEVARGLAMIDRRLGKRRLSAFDISAEHPFVQCLYRLRCQTEGIEKE